MAQPVQFDAGADANPQQQNPPAGAQNVDKTVKTIKKMLRYRRAVWVRRQCFGVHVSLEIYGPSRDDDEIVRFQHNVLVRFVVLEDADHVNLERFCGA